MTLLFFMTITSLLQAHYTKYSTLKLSSSVETTNALFIHLNNAKIISAKRYLFCPVIYKFTLNQDRNNVVMCDGPIGLISTKFKTIINIVSCPMENSKTTLNF